MKPGIKVLRDIEGLGTEITNSSKVTITYSCYLNDGDAVFENRTEEIDLSNRTVIAGLRYGLEGMKVGGTRKFKASPHLCYGERGVDGLIRANAVLVFDIHEIKLSDVDKSILL